MFRLVFEHLLHAKTVLVKIIMKFKFFSWKKQTSTKYNFKIKKDMIWEQKIDWEQFALTFKFLHKIKFLFFDNWNKEHKYNCTCDLLLFDSLKCYSSKIFKQFAPWRFCLPPSSFILAFHIFEKHGILKLLISLV